MKKAKRRELVTVALGAGWIAAVALAVALWTHRAALERANRRVAALAPLAERTSVRDRLIGTDLSELRFAGLEQGEHAAVGEGAKTLVWLVDPRECANCLSDLSGWAGLERSPLSVTTVLVGVSREEARRIAERVPLPGRVAVDPRGDVASTLGVSSTLPSLFLVLDASGKVLMTEARQAAASCDWSFSGQVAALISGSEQAVLRRAAGP